MYIYTPFLVIIAEINDEEKSKPCVLHTTYVHAIHVCVHTCLVVCIYIHIYIYTHTHMFTVSCNYRGNKR